MSTTIPFRAPAAPTRRCPGGCNHRIQLTEFACPDCLDRLPYAMRQALQASRGRDLTAYRDAYRDARHHARLWLGANPPPRTPS